MHSTVRRLSRLCVLESRKLQFCVTMKLGFARVNTTFLSVPWSRKDGSVVNIALGIWKFEFSIWII